MRSCWFAKHTSSGGGNHNRGLLPTVSVVAPPLRHMAAVPEVPMRAIIRPFMRSPYACTRRIINRFQAIAAPVVCVKSGKLDACDGGRGLLRLLR